MTDYDPAKVEAEAQQYWHKQRSFAVREDPDREKFYCLSMLPYPSGQLHIGHVRNYTLGDVISRYQRMLGKNVLQPMGWDAFGLPAENAAIENQTPPAAWTRDNIQRMREQLERFGFAYDWQRELATCDPDYYRWEQWFFNRLLEKGLAYKRLAEVNWDPVEQTVLANEQVENGRGWRSGAIIERRKIPQWFLRITAYAEELLNEIDNLDGWPEAVKTMQRNWIGRSEGVGFSFEVPGEERVGVYTTRPDTLMGVTALFVSAEHPLAAQAAAKDPALKQFIDDCLAIKTAEAELETLEKAGRPLPYSARHPITGEELPVWAANFVLAGYGTGAVMAVPAHDQRDFEFARKHDIAIRPVIKPPQDHDYAESAMTGSDGTLIESGEFDGLSCEQAKAAVADKLEAMGIGQREVNYRLRDWGVSRQRYWGCPIPVLYDEDDTIVPVPDAELPVRLPEDVAFSGTKSPLGELPEFREAGLPDGRPARRETDTFDTFVESSWYFHRYCCADSDKAMLDERVNYWLPVDQYIGGIEHAVLHLLYARFFHKLLRDAGLVKSDEPFTRLLTQGMVLKDGHKMSKSRGNTVNPDVLVQKHGADAVRLFVMFAAPPEQALEWNDQGLVGASRFLNRWWRLSHAEQACVRDAGDPAGMKLDEPARALRRATHQFIRQADRDIAKQQYNTVVAGGMTLFNQLEKFADDPAARQPDGQAVLREGLLVLTRALSPIAPHIAHHLWQLFEQPGAVIDSRWPEADPEALTAAEQTIVVQINGKRRGEMQLPVGCEEADIEAAARAHPNVAQQLADREVRRVIVVPGRLINLVL